MDVSLWTEERSTEADYQGWNLFTIDGNPSKLVIQKVDELEVFKSDEEALDFVKAWAKEVDNKNFDYFATSTCSLALYLVENQGE